MHIEIKNVRAISMLPIIGNIFENNVSKQLINYINDNNLFDVHQSAYNRYIIMKLLYFAHYHEWYLFLSR